MVQHRAATLIELLVVISMMALLISILIPSLKQSMRLARAAVCMHNLREIGVSLALYRVEHDGWLPAGDRSNVGGELVRPNVEDEPVFNGEPWFVRLFPGYMPDPLVLTCPEDPYRWRLVKVGGQLDDPFVAEYPSYGLNGFVATAGNGYLADVDRHQPTRPLDTILVADLGPDDLRSVAMRANPVHATSVEPAILGPFRNGGLLAWDNRIDPISGRSPDPWLTTRHRYGIHVLTLAGGVREARTANVMRRPLSRYYSSCSGGGCTFCNELRLTHYSFADDHLYWWTGPVPLE